FGGSAPQSLYGFAPPAAVLAVVPPKAVLRSDRRTACTPMPSPKPNGPAVVLRAWVAVCLIWPLLVYVPPRVTANDAVSRTGPALVVSAPPTVTGPVRKTGAAVFASVRLLKLNPGIDWGEAPLKVTVLPVVT